MERHEYIRALASGAAAGFSVDMALFPLDTIKTRLQSSVGFLKSGGFRGIYAGVQSAAVGSAPSAAMFFIMYESCKGHLSTGIATMYNPFVHMVSAAMGETMACLVRVPCEVIKQRAQTSPGLPQIRIFREALQSEGLFGLYRGYTSTVLREVPFSFIQFPLWEMLKSTWSFYQERRVDPWQSAVCGAVAGGVSAALTTPLDVAKTRIMLAASGTVLAKGSITAAIRAVYLERGLRGLFAGVSARVTMISLGGAVFLGVYDKVRCLTNAWR